MLPPRLPHSQSRSHRAPHKPPVDAQRDVPRQGEERVVDDGTRNLDIVWVHLQNRTWFVRRTLIVIPPDPRLDPFHAMLDPPFDEHVAIMRHGCEERMARTCQPKIWPDP
eukprot:scaffold1353_cov161-Amphora_coffeaeformis.AAC.39